MYANPPEIYALIRPSNESKNIPVRQIIAALPGDIADQRYDRCRLRFDYRTNRPLRREAAEFNRLKIATSDNYIMGACRYIEIRRTLYTAGRPEKTFCGASPVEPSESVAPA